MRYEVCWEASVSTCRLVMVSRSTASERYAELATKAWESARPRAAVAPRGQKRKPTTTLTPHPMATSSILVRPTLHPTGWMMLNRITTMTVKAACPATKEIIDGATPERRTARGSSAHSKGVWSEIPIMSAAPTTTPSAVPPTARRRGGSRPERVGAEHRHRAERHPEAVLHVGDLDHHHGDGQADGAAQRVAEPHRAEREMGAKAPDEEQGVRFAPGAEPAVEHPGGTGRLERAVGHHAGGDTEGAGTKPRIERAGQARRSLRGGLRRVVHRGVIHRGVVHRGVVHRGVGDGGDVGPQGRRHEFVELAGRALHRLDRGALAHRVARSVAHERSRELQRLGHLLEDGARRWGPVGPLRLGRDGGGRHAGVPRHPLDPADQLGQGNRSGGGARGRIGRPRELSAEFGQRGRPRCGHPPPRRPRQRPAAGGADGLRPGAPRRKGWPTADGAGRRARVPATPGGRPRCTPRRQSTSPAGGGRWPTPDGRWTPEGRR